MSSPSVVLVIPTYNGAHFLEECLDSVAALDYPRELLETIVVDNGSTDGTAELIAKRYPWARVLRQSENTGFAAAVNAGARAASADCLALANNDMRLDPAWLRELVAAYDPATPCVAGLILDATGERVDFADAYLSFYGMGGQGGFGARLEDVPLDDGRELLFACGGSLLVDRALFLALGGFDESFFAYFEDVDFGWRLWLSGHRVRLAAGARSFHRHHGTAGVFPQPQRAVLYDRNALLMLTKNLDERNLYRILTAALCLTSERALADSGTDPRAYELDGPAPPQHESVPANAVARVHAISQFVARLDDAMAERARIQALRRRSDEEIFALFRRPFWPVYREEGYLEASARLVRALGLGALFPDRRASRLLLVGAGGSATAELARTAGRHVRVVVATAEPIELPGFETVEVTDDDELGALVRESDIVLVEPDGALGESAARLAEGVRPVLRAGSLDELPDLVEQPWRFGLDTRGATTEDAQVLASVRRARAAAPPPQRGPARLFWGRVPEPLRARLRPVVRRLRSDPGG